MTEPVRAWVACLRIGYSEALMHAEEVSYKARKPAIVNQNTPKVTNLRLVSEIVGASDGKVQDSQEV